MWVCVFMTRPGIRYRCVWGAVGGDRATGAGAGAAGQKERYLANDSGYGLLSQCLWVIRVRGVCVRGKHFGNIFGRLFVSL